MRKIRKIEKIKNKINCLELKKNKVRKGFNHTTEFSTEFFIGMTGQLCTKKKKV